MRLIILLLLSVSTVSADYLFINIGAGNNTNLTGASIPWDDAGGVGCAFTLGYVTPVKGSKNLHFGTRWLHISQCDQGAPFNDNPESSVDHIGIFLEYRIDV